MFTATFSLQIQNLGGSATNLKKTLCWWKSCCFDKKQNATRCSGNRQWINHDEESNLNTHRRDKTIRSVWTNEEAVTFIKHFRLLDHSQRLFNYVSAADAICSGWIDALKKHVVMVIFWLKFLLNLESWLMRTGKDKKKEDKLLLGEYFFLFCCWSW